MLFPAPGAAMLTGEKLAFNPAGPPVAARVTAFLKLPVVVVVKVTAPLFPANRLNVVVDTMS